MRVSGCSSTYIDSFQPAIQRALKQLRDISHIALSAILYVGAVIFQYQSLGLKIVKVSLKVTLHFYSESMKKVEKVIIGIALWSISLKLFFQIPSLYEKSKKLEKSLKTKDSGEITWAAFNFAIKPCKVLDALLSLGKSLHKLIEISWLKLFQIATTPLSVICLSFNFIKRVYKISVLIIEYKQMVNITEQSGLIAYLDEKIGITASEAEKMGIEISENWKVEFNEQKTLLQKNKEEETEPSKEKSSNKKLGIFEKAARNDFRKKTEVLQSLKIERLKRRVDKRIVSFMKNAKKHFDAQKNASLEEKNLVLHDIKKMFLRRTVLDAGKTLFVVAEMIVQIASLAFNFYSVAFSLGFSVTKTLFSTFKFLYIEKRMHVGLKKTEFYPVK